MFRCSSSNKNYCMNERLRYVHHHWGRENIIFQLPSFQHNFGFLKKDTTLKYIFKLKLSFKRNSHPKLKMVIMSL